MDLGGDDEAYLARVAWLPDGSLCAQLENREQTALDLVRFDPATGEDVAVYDAPEWNEIQARLVAPRPEPDGRSSVALGLPRSMRCCPFRRNPT